MQMLGSFQKDLREPQIQARVIQVGIVKVSRVKVSLTQGSGTIAELEQTLDLRVISLLEGSVCAESEEDHALLSKIKDNGVNLATLPLQNFHVLHQGVLDKLRIREKRALAVINKFKVNNEQMFEEKSRALK